MKPEIDGKEDISIESVGIEPESPSTYFTPHPPSCITKSVF
jgi:hypothetical protein